jgi:hypothetical protein
MWNCALKLWYFLLKNLKFQNQGRSRRGITYFEVKKLLIERPVNKLFEDSFSPLTSQLGTLDTQKGATHLVVFQYGK